MNIKISHTITILFRGLQIGAGKERGQKPQTRSEMEARITGSIKKGFVVQYHRDGKLMAIGKGKTILEAGEMAKRMLQSLEMSKRLRC